MKIPVSKFWVFQCLMKHKVWRHFYQNDKTLGKYYTWYLREILMEKVNCIDFRKLKNLIISTRRYLVCTDRSLKVFFTFNFCHSPNVFISFFLHLASLISFKDHCVYGQNKVEPERMRYYFSLKRRRCFMYLIIVMKMISPLYSRINLS